MNTRTIDDVIGSAYGSPAECYQRYFVPAIGGPFAEDLVAEARLAPGERVLDVACGTGVVARLAAERVGSTGAVSAVDLNPAMLAVARTVPSRGAAIQWLETSAESMPLPDASYDVVFCQLGLQFIPDRLAALAEMRRVLAPDGRLLMSTPPPNAFFDILGDALERHAGAAPAGFARAVFSLGDPATLTLLCRKTGFDDVTVRTDDKTLRLPSARDFFRQYVHATPLSAMLADVVPARLTSLENDIVERWQPWSDAEGMTCEQHMNVTVCGAH